MLVILNLALDIVLASTWQAASYSPYSKRTVGEKWGEKQGQK